MVVTKSSSPRGAHGWKLPLKGAGGEPVDLRRTILSHGVAGLPPFEVDDPGGTWLEVTLPVGRGKPRTVRVEAAGRKHLAVTVSGPAPSSAAATSLESQIRHVLRLDEDLSEFYDRTSDDPALSWVCGGAGRMIQSPTVFEEVVKTVCTTNCAWGATVRMVTALVQHLGEARAGAARDDWRGRTFPTAEVMANTDESFYREVARAGYRGAYLISLARSVASGDVDLEAWGRADRDELPDDELEARLLALPGVGPYAAAHIMMMMGRYSRLILDSWTRPKYARLMGKKKVADATIQRRFKRYGPYAGLAFWLFVTSDW